MTPPPFLRVRFKANDPGRRITAAEIVDTILAEIHAGKLPEGGRLPPVRALEHQLGISKNTAQSAYDELRARGAVESRGRKGLFVSARSPRGGSRGAVGSPRFSPAAPRLAASPWSPPARSRAELPLSKVFVDPELLPRERIAECFRSVLRRPGLHSFYDFQGYPPLRDWIARRLRARGIPAGRDEVILTIGSQQALDIACRALRERRIATEDPAYHIARGLFGMNQMTVTRLPFDPFSGIDLDDWERRLRAGRPSLLYVTPTFHNPTGYSYSTSELEGILDLSARLGFGLLEDDWGSDMLSHGEFRPGLRSLGGSRVLYMNSFTKKLLPSLRIGYLLADAGSMPSLLAAKRVATLGNPALIEAALFEFLDRGYYDAHLKKLQAELDARYASALAALRAGMPAEVRWTTPGGGPLIWIEAPRRVDLRRLQERLEARGVEIELSDAAFFGRPHLHGFKLGYAFLSPDRLKHGIEVLASALRRELDGAGTGRQP